MTQKNRTHGSAMSKFAQTSLLLLAVACIGLTGCTAGSGGLASSPVFPPSTLDYSSQLDKQQASQGGSPYAPLGGFDNAPNRGPLFSLGSNSRSHARGGSC